jgi:hypothetical protein
VSPAPALENLHRRTAPALDRTETIWGVPLGGDDAYRQTANGAGRSLWSILSLRPADALHEPTHLPDVPIRAGELQSSSSANATQHHTRLVALLRVSRPPDCCGFQGGR